MRYKYVCTTCDLEDVKNFHYRMDKDTGVECRVCPECGNMLKRKFVNPPRGWFNQISRSSE